MLLCSRILSFLIIGITISQKFVNAELKHKSFETVFQNGNFVKDVDSLASPGQVYGSCHDEDVQEGVFTAECSLFMETKNPIDSEDSSSDHLNQCNFALHANANSENEVYHVQNIVDIDRNKAVLTSQSSHYTKLFILNFAGCEAVPVQRDFNTTYVKIYAPFDDVFDIFISEEEELCETGHLCKLTIDTSGNVIIDAENWPGKFHQLSTVAHSRSLGRVMVDIYKMVYSDRTVARVYTAKNDTLYTILHEYIVDEDQESIPTSITETFVSLCSPHKTNVTCAQFDLYAKLKFAKTLTISDNREIQHINIHNLPEGGLLLLIQACDKQDSESCIDGETFYVKKLNAFGETVGRLVIHELGKVNVEDLHFFESKDNNMCLSHVQRNWVGVDKVKLDVVCFTDEDLFAEASTETV